MHVLPHTPSPALRPYIRAILVLESADGMDNRVVPDTSIVLSLRYAGAIRTREEGLLPWFGLSGLRRSPRLLQYEAGAGNIIVLFREGAAGRFFPVPLHELFGASHDLGAFIHGSVLAQLEDRLGEANSVVERVAVVEAFLLERLRVAAEDRMASGDRLVSAAVRRIRETGGIVRIGELLREIPLSRDPFEKRFRQVVGTSPKQFSSIVRFRSLLDGYAKPDSLTRKAYDAGYFDQAHFIKDFRTFTGETPRAFFAADFW